MALSQTNKQNKNEPAGNADVLSLGRLPCPLKPTARQPLRHLAYHQADAHGRGIGRAEGTEHEKTRQGGEVWARQAERRGQDRGDVFSRFVSHRHVFFSRLFLRNCRAP